MVNYRNYIIKLIIISLLFTFKFGIAQSLMSLKEAINLAQQQSFTYKVAANSLQSSIWSYRSYLASRKPVLNLDGTLPNYSRSINKITLPNGEDAFVSQNQAFSAMYLNLKQQIAATGGTLSVGSSLNRIDVFGNNRSKSYSIVPISLMYNQNNIGYNDFKWQKKIEPIRIQLADKTFAYNMEDISLSTIDLYFAVLNVKIRKELSEQNVQNSDTLLRIATERYKLGSIGHSELLQLRLNVLNARKQSAQDSVDLIVTRQRLSSFLALENNVIPSLILPEEISFFSIKFNGAFEKAMVNSNEILKYKLDHLEAERVLTQTNSENKLKFNIYANLGFSNTSRSFPRLLNNLENQQDLAIGFSLPILDWGNSKTKRLRAEANLSMVESQIAQKRMEFEQEIILQVSKWNLLKEQIQIVNESKKIAIENYDLERERFLRGSISLNDLIIAQGNKDNATLAYNDILQTYWKVLYSIRKLTLYDFNKGEEITYSINIR